MDSRWYPKGKPPHGAELWRLLQEDVGVYHVDFTDGGKDMVGSFNCLERQLRSAQQENALLQRQLAAAHELISRSANVYLRYYRLRHKVLVWWATRQRQLRRWWV